MIDTLISRKAVIKSTKRCANTERKDSIECIKKFEEEKTIDEGDSAELPE